MTGVHVLGAPGRGTMAPWGGAYAKPRSLCGIKNPVPVVLDRFVMTHMAGWGMTVCPACLRILDGRLFDA